jgi:nitric oxide reductase activation protein
VGKFQTDTLEGMRSAEVGRLSPRRLWRSAVNDGKVFLKRQPRQMESTAVHILLDVSGSTHKIIGREVQSAYAIVKALQDVRGISCGVSAFPVAYLDSYFEGTPGISWLVRHGQRVGDSFPDVRFYGMTPLAEAVWWVTGQMRRLRQKRKLLVIFTDGFPDSAESAAKALEDARASGIEVYGIGYQHPNIKDLIAEADSIDDIDELPEALSSLLSAKLRRRGNALFS